MTLGAGWRLFTGYASFVDVRGLYSFKNYKMGEARVRFPKNFGGRFDTGFRVGWRDATQIGFYGLGNDTSEDDRANFRIQQAYVEAGAVLRPVPWMFLEAAAGYDDFEEDSGLGSDPGIEEVYDSTTAPGLFNDPTYVRARGAGGFNWLKNPGYSRKGGFLRVSHDHFFPSEGTGGGDFGIGRVEAGAAPADIPRDVGAVAARPRRDGGQQRRRYAVFPAALARQRRHAARLPDGPVPRPQHDALQRRVAVVPQPPRVRRRRVRRRRDRSPRTSITSSSRT